MTETVQLASIRCNIILTGKITTDQMYGAMYKAAALSGFTANVPGIPEKKLYPKTKKIQNIPKLHHARYDFSEAKTKFHV